MTRALLTGAASLLLALTASSMALAEDPVQVPSTEPKEQRKVKPKKKTKKAPTIQVVFVVDTTGSMSGLIDGAKRKVWSIANEILSGKPRPRVSIGLVAYRDRGDAYVTQVTQPTEDLDTIYKALFAFRADGGGDGPEHVNKALDDAFNTIEWSSTSDLKLVYLVGDAPAHRDYDKQLDYTKIIPPARSRGIVVNAVLCGGNSTAKRQFMEITQLGGGSFFQIQQDGGMAAVSTPYDKKMLELQRKLDGTRVTYGSRRERADDEDKKADALEMAGEAGAHRASAKAKSGGSGWSTRDLVQTFAAGKLDTVPEDKLPAELKKLSHEERIAKLENLLAQRILLQKELVELAKQRDGWLKKNAPKDGFDGKVMESLKKQAATKGIKYE